MTNKKKVTPINSSSNTLQIKQEKGKTKERQFAEIALSPITLNGFTTSIFTKNQMGETDLTETISVMRDLVSKVNAGDLNEMEATLTSQTVSLNAIFNELARRAALNIGTHMQATEGYMRLALKAQSQCARTIEVLAGMKNPPVVFAKQANISHGHQQVNNGNNQTNMHARMEKTINQPNEQLEVNNGSKTMDGGATQTTIPEDKAMATMAK
ncbi:MAG: hypothetical protein H7Z18_08265 [Methylophilaceae bacterium]|nr:hypothetical protein [Methylophilaceae bacterium]